MALSTGDTLVVERAIRLQRLKRWEIQDGGELGNLNSGDSRGMTFWFRTTPFLVTDASQVFELHGPELNELVVSEMSLQIEGYLKR